MTCTVKYYAAATWECSIQWQAPMNFDGPLSSIWRSNTVYIVSYWAVLITVNSWITAFMWCPFYACTNIFFKKSSWAYVVSCFAGTAGVFLLIPSIARQFSGDRCRARAEQVHSKRTIAESGRFEMRVSVTSHCCTLLWVKYVWIGVCGIMMHVFEYYLLLCGAVYFFDMFLLCVY